MGGPVISERSGDGIKSRPYTCLCGCTAALKRMIPKDSRGLPAEWGFGGSWKCGPRDLKWYHR